MNLAVHSMSGDIRLGNVHDRVVSKVDILRKATLQSRVRTNEVLHRLGVASRDYNKPVATIFHAFDENFDGNDDQNGIPAIALGFRPAGDLDKIPELCDYAIEAVAHLAELATKPESKLADVKTEAEKRIQQRTSDG